MLTDIQRRSTLIGAAILAFSIALAGCAGSAPASETSSATPSPPQTKAAATSTPTVEPEVEVEPAEFTPIDVTADLQAAAGDAVTKATRVEESRIEVQTSITDPRGDAGSVEAQQAVSICNAALALGVTKVSVFELDGTTYVVAGHPAYGPDCFEV